MSAAGVSLDIARELRAICGDDHVVDPHYDNLPGRIAPSRFPVMFVSPGTADEVAAIMRLANQCGIGIAPVGMPPALWIAKPPIDIALSTARLTEIEHYDPADLTAGIGAGMTVAQLNALVGADKLMFACDPPFPDHTTIGAVLAAAMHGPMRHGYGALRDYCIGIRFITGDGRKAKAGGRVVKNVAGYDLMKLLIGSYGTLAVITSASFKLFPAPRQTRTFLAEFRTWQEALKFRDLVVRSPLAPMCLEIASPQARKMMQPEMSDDAWVICLRAAGSDTVLARYRKELGSAITREVDGADEFELWRAIDNFPFSKGDEGQMEFGLPTWSPVDIMFPPSELPRVVEACNLLHDPIGRGTNCAFIGRIGIGHLRLIKWHLPDAYLRAAVEDLRERLPDLTNFVTPAQRSPWPVQPPDLDSMRAVKQALDPNNVLRGRELF